MQSVTTVLAPKSLLFMGDWPPWQYMQCYLAQQECPCQMASHSVQ